MQTGYAMSQGKQSEPFFEALFFLAAARPIPENRGLFRNSGTSSGKSDLFRKRSIVPEKARFSGKGVSIPEWVTCCRIQEVIPE